MIAVTGGNGFVGRALLAGLQAAGQPAVGLVRDQRAAAAIARHPIAGDVRVAGDLAAAIDWQLLLRDVRVVVHTAARVHVMHAEGDDADALYHQINTEASVRLGRAAAAVGVQRLVYLSTVKVLGESTRPGTCFDAESAANPGDPYARSKWAAEQALARVADETGLDVVVVRPPLVYGPGVGGNFQRLMRLVRLGVPLPLACVDNRRSLIGLGNLVDVLLHACAHPSAAGEPLLVADAEPVSTADLVRAMAEALQRPPRLWPMPPRLLRGLGRVSGRQAELGRLLDDLVVDTRQTQALLDWAPTRSMAAELAAMVAAER